MSSEDSSSGDAPDADSDVIDFEAFLATIACPDTPADAVVQCPALSEALAPLDGTALAHLASGLQTAGSYQANSVRLEWLVRLALALGRGRKQPSRRDLDSLLNILLVEARVGRLEDPLEDVMIEPVCTADGDRLIFTGTWEKAGHFTESLLDAFSILPGGGPRDAVLAHANALLMLSDALVARSGHRRFALGRGQPKASLALPSARDMKEFAARTLFTRADLEALNLSPTLLEAFILEEEDYGALLDQLPGASLLERFPLLRSAEGIQVVLPANLSVAARALLIDTAFEGGMEKELRKNLLEVQTGLVAEGGLLPIRAPIMAIAGGFKREQMGEMSLGRFVHILGCIPDYADWPDRLFTWSEACVDELGAAIGAAVQRARDFAASQQDFVSGTSFILLSGWGTGAAIKIEIPGLLGWRVIVIEAHDGFILGGCDDAAVRDLIWMKRQYQQVEAQGFDFQFLNGFLNLFQWWRHSDRAFVPPDMVDVRPPISIAFDTNLLLEARREAQLAWDRRMLPRPDGSFVRVMRMDPKSLFDDLQPVYADYAAARRGHIISAVLFGEWPLWFELDQSPSEPGFDVAIETYRALLQWCVRVVPVLLGEAFGQDTAPSHIDLRIELEGDTLAPAPVPDTAAIERSISVTLDRSTRRARIVVAPQWQHGLQREDNYAEAALAAAAINAIAELLGRPSPPACLERVRAAIGGADARWRHWVEVRTASETLKAYGLVRKFRAVPNSAAALVKTGVAWVTHPRETGHVIEGREACRAFLDDQVALIETSLFKSLGQFRREPMVRAALRAMHAAQADEQSWLLSARALRAIHGRGRDGSASLTRKSEGNAVLRACSMLAELALIHSPIDTGRAVGDWDLAELQAHALLLFQTADLIPAIEGGRIEHRFNISPTGDVLHDHGFEEKTVQRTVEIVHEAQRDRAERDYGRRANPPPKPPANPPIAIEGLEAAVAAEYGTDCDTLLSLGDGCAHLAGERGADVFTIRRSELLKALETLHERGTSLGAVVDRLTMHPRATPEDIPLGAEPRDFDIAKLDRRFSLIGRPILALTAEADPQLLVAPGVIERAARHNLTGAIEGTLQNEFWMTRAMRRFASERGRLEGLQFNHDIAERLRELGLDAYDSAQPSWCFDHQRTQEVAELGDFDVLAITPDGRRAWVVEAKDLKLCRTIGEAARRLSDYEGRMLASGKPDKMLRHLRRVAYARTHASDLQRRLKLPVLPEISGIMVIRAPQPMETIAISENADARVVTLARLSEVNWEAASSGN